MNLLETALQSYRKSKGEKSGVLFLGSEVLYLFDEQYCRAHCIWQSLSSPIKQLNLQNHQEDLLFWRNRKTWTLAFPEALVPELDFFWSLLHIPVESQEHLRILFYCDGTRSYSLLFTDPMMEELLKLLLTKKACEAPRDNPQIRHLLQEQHESDLQALTTLYLQGQKLSNLALSPIPENKKTN